MGNEERCVCCGAVIPEGFQVCPKCRDTKPRQGQNLYRGVCYTHQGLELECIDGWNDIVTWVEEMRETHDVKDIYISRME